MATKRATPKLSVCILSPHPLVLGEFERILAKADFKVIPTQLESMLAPDLRSFEPPPAQVYVIDAHASKPATGALLASGNGTGAPTGRMNASCSIVRWAEL